MKQGISDYTVLVLYVLGGTCFIVFALWFSRFLQKRMPNPVKGIFYECGELPTGSAGTMFAMRYYLMALLFVLFEVELLFLLPWARVMGVIVQSQGTAWGWVVFIEMSFFVGLLFFGLVYAWKKGDMRSIGPRSHFVSDWPSKVPTSMYTDLNTRYE